MSISSIQMRIYCLLGSLLFCFGSCVKKSVNTGISASAPDSESQGIVTLNDSLMKMNALSKDGISAKGRKVTVLMTDTLSACKLLEEIGTPDIVVSYVTTHSRKMLRLSDNEDECVLTLLDNCPIS